MKDLTRVSVRVRAQHHSLHIIRVNSNLSSIYDVSTIDDLATSTSCFKHHRVYQLITTLANLKSYLCLSCTAAVLIVDPLQDSFLNHLKDLRFLYGRGGQ